MSGYLSSERPRSINKSINWDVKMGPDSRPIFITNPITMTERLTTFRSGARYLSELNGGATQLPGAPLLDRTSRTLGDYGHEFNHEFVDEYTSCPRAIISRFGDTYVGPLFWSPASTYAGAPKDAFNTAGLGLSPAQLDALGTSAIAQCYPTKPQSDLLVALAELLREGLPSALFSALTTMGGNSKRELVRNLSSDYLNYIFGITPLVREADKLIKTVQKIDQYVTQLVTDSGNLVRRSREVHNKRMSTWNGYQPSYPASYRFYNGNTSLQDYTQVIWSQKRDQRVWFSGAFQYWIPGIKSPEEGDSPSSPSEFMADLDIRLGILGFRATPKAGWNLLPFSWLVDWFVNVSDLLEAADAMNRFGLVMPYGYVMCEEKLTSTTTVDTRSNGLKYGSVSSVVIATRQQRKRATPYGFGLKDTELNPIQWSILAALGLSTGRR